MFQVIPGGGLPWQPAVEGVGIKSDGEVLVGGQRLLFSPSLRGQSFLLGIGRCGPSEILAGPRTMSIDCRTPGKDKAMKTQTHLKAGIVGGQASNPNEFPF